MTALAIKIRNFWEDLWLDLGLRFGKIFKSKPKPEKPKSAAPAPAATPPKSDLPIAAPKIAMVTPVKPVAGPQAAPSKKQAFGIRMLRLSGKGRLFFFDQMATLIGSGVTLIDSLNLVRAQTKNQNLKKLYDEMIHHINAGMGLAEAMRLFPHIFPGMQVALIEAGEKSGNLKTVLTEIVNEMEAGQDFLRKVTGAMFYPAVLVFLALSLVTGMMVFVIPRISKMYDQARVELPKLTQTVINISDFVREKWPFLLGGVLGGGIVLGFIFSKTRFGKLVWEKFVGLIPVFGAIAKEKSLMVIASTMAMLLKSGVLISDAFEITQKTVGSLHYERAIEKVRKDVVMGKPISQSMGLENLQAKNFKENKLFPLQFAQLVHIGETTGTISQMLSKARDNYHKSIDYKLKNISTMIEPLMIFIVAALVGSILLAVMLPFFYIGTTIH